MFFLLDCEQTLVCSVLLSMLFLAFSLVPDTQKVLKFFAVTLLSSAKYLLILSTFLYYHTSLAEPTVVCLDSWNRYLTDLPIFLHSTARLTFLKYKFDHVTLSKALKGLPTAEKSKTPN